MFEAVFRITALVKSDGQGQRVFRITEREAPADDAEFLSRLATMYQEVLLDEKGSTDRKKEAQIRPCL